MDNIDNITKKIEKLRKNLSDLILVKDELVDPEIVKASKLLDKALNEYSRKVHGGVRQM